MIRRRKLKNLRKTYHRNECLTKRYNKPESKIKKKDNGLIVKTGTHYILHNKDMLKDYGRCMKIVNLFIRIKSLINNQWFISLFFFILSIILGF